MPRFVLLEHDHPHLHWDLMLEDGGTLLTWRLARPLEAGEEVEAERTPDHRLLYLDYEGPVSGGRGSVVRREAGTFSWVERGEELIADLVGGRLLGRLTLRKEEGEQWRAELAPLTEFGEPLG